MFIKQNAAVVNGKKYTLLLASVLLSSMFLSACNSLSDSKLGVSIVDSISLSAELTETSALYCPTDERIYTVNDSGNSAIVYQLDNRGNITQTNYIDSENNDWEALTGDDRYLYIGDIGNNGGKRANLNVVVLDKNSLQKVSVLNIKYENNSIEQNEYLKHDFDAEALVNYQDALILFSKSWLTNNLHIYSLNKTQTQQTIKPIANVEGIPGVVTGGAYNLVNNQFVLVGYKLKSLGFFTPFIAILDADFSIVAQYSLSGFSQVEGVCVSPAGNIWISQEKTMFSGPKLAHILIQ